MELKLFWTDFSQKELEKIYEYYRDKARSRIAKKLVNGIYNETLKLKRQPKIVAFPKNVKATFTKRQVY